MPSNLNVIHVGCANILTCVELPPHLHPTPEYSTMPAAQLCSTLYGFDAMERRRRLTRRLPAAALAEAAQRVAAPACRAAPAGLAAPAVLDTPAVQPAPAIQPAPAVQPEPAAAAAQVAVSPERAMEIQASLASLLGKVEVNGAPVARILEWVDADLKKRARPECTPDELDVVLGALEARDAVMVTNADATSPRTVWFTY